MRHLETLPLGTPFPEVAGRVAELAQKAKVTRALLRRYECGQTAHKEALPLSRGHHRCNRCRTAGGRAHSRCHRTGCLGAWGYLHPRGPLRRRPRAQGGQGMAGLTASGIAAAGKTSPAAYPRCREASSGTARLRNEDRPGCQRLLRRPQGGGPRQSGHRLGALCAAAADEVPHSRWPCLFAVLSCLC